MSEMVHYKGKIKKVEYLESKEEFCIEILRGAGFSEDQILEDRRLCYDSYTEFVACELYNKYVNIGNDLYEILTKTEVESYNDIFDGTECEDGSINYEVKYYNGGCGFSEALERTSENITKKGE